MAGNRRKYPDSFIWKGIEFRREPGLEYYTLIYSNHIYYAKWEGNEKGPAAFADFKEYYTFVKTICEPEDLKYFVETKRIRVKGIDGYGYLQPKLSLTEPRYLRAKKMERILEELAEKYSLEDFGRGHNVGYTGKEFKIFDLNFANGD